jgi:hypothetical protein
MASREGREPAQDAGRALAELGRISLGSQPLAASLARIASLAVEAVPGAAEASVTLVERRQVRSVGVTGRLAAALDERQYEMGFGPCVEAALTGGAVRIEALPTRTSIATSRRWPAGTA